MHFADNLKSILHSRPTQRKHGHIIEECKPSCLVPSHEGPTRLIQAVRPPSRQQKSLMSSTQRRMKLRIVLVLCSIHPCQQPMHLPYLQLSFHLAPCCSEGHPPSHHLFLHQISAVPLLPAAQSLHHLPPFLQQSIPILFCNMTFLWARLVVMLAAANFENANTTQDL